MYLDFLWSKGLYYRSGYMRRKNTCKPEEDFIIKQILNDVNIIWIRTNVKMYDTKDLDYFAKNINLLNKDIILITGDSDLNVPSCYSYDTIITILNNKFVKKWFTQNYDKSIIHKKLNYYPIGLDLHTRKWLINKDQLEKISYIIKIRFMNLDRIDNKIFCDTHLRLTHIERKLMYEKIKNNLRINFSNTQYGFNKIVILYRKHKFVLSPIGNGLDCHRTWELFLLGCIVITKSSSLDEMWIKNKLPVVIINDWSDLNFNLKTKTKLWIKKYEKYTNFDYILNKFKINYWLNLDDGQTNKFINFNIKRSSFIVLKNIWRSKDKFKELDGYISNDEKKDYIIDEELEVDKLTKRTTFITSKEINDFDIDDKEITINTIITDKEVEEYINKFTNSKIIN